MLLIAIAPADQFKVALAGMFITGMMNPIANGALTAIMQSNVKPEMQGRVFTTLNSMASAMSLFRWSLQRRWPGSSAFRAGSILGIRLHCH